MTDSILTAEGVSVVFPGASVPAVDNVTLRLGAGRSIGIVGESGSGKTTLGRVLVGLQTPTSGTVRVAGKPWETVRRSDDIRRRVQTIFQDPASSLNPRMSARESVAEVLRVWKRRRTKAANLEALALLRNVGISDREAVRRPVELSGGQCQRVAIARALACEPDILIADEPTSSLDVSVQAQILNLMRELQQSREFALVMISHDLSVIGYMTEECIVMKDGRVVESDLTAETLKSPRKSYTQKLVASIPQLPQVDAQPAAWLLAGGWERECE